MKYYEKYRRKSLRIPDYCYSDPSDYFITICTKNSECIFGEIVGDKMVLNNISKIIEEEWSKTSEIRNNIYIDEFVIMPNHLHGIITILDNADGQYSSNTVHRVATKERFGKPTPNSIPTIIRSFKAVTTKRINKLGGCYGQSIWQSNYYEHIIRNEKSLNRIRDYIRNNSNMWDKDRNNPENLK